MNERSRLGKDAALEVDSKAGWNSRSRRQFLLRGDDVIENKQANQGPASQLFSPLEGGSQLHIGVDFSEPVSKLRVIRKYRIHAGKDIDGYALVGQIGPEWHRRNVQRPAVFLSVFHQDRKST